MAVFDAKFEGEFTADLRVSGIVGRNAATVVLTADDGEDDFSVVGTSKRHPGEVYDAEVGGALALADALEKLAAKYRENLR